MAELETVARPYAKALIMMAKEDMSNASNWDNYLLSLKSAVESEEAFSFMRSPEVSSADKEQFLSKISEELLGRKLTDQEKQFLSVIGEAKRFEILPAIYDDFKDQLLKEQNVLKASIKSAYPLTDAQYKMFVEALKKRSQKEVELTVSVEPELMGGAVLSIEDRVIDGSILGRLNKMIRTMN